MFKANKSWQDIQLESIECDVHWISYVKYFFIFHCYPRLFTRWICSSEYFAEKRIYPHNLPMKSWADFQFALRMEWKIAKIQIIFHFFSCELFEPHFTSTKNHKKYSDWTSEWTLPSFRQSRSLKLAIETFSTRNVLSESWKRTFNLQRTFLSFLIRISCSMKCSSMEDDISMKKMRQKLSKKSSKFLNMKKGKAKKSNHKSESFMKSKFSRMIQFRKFLHKEFSNIFLLRSRLKLPRVSQVSSHVYSTLPLLHALVGSAWCTKWIYIYRTWDIQAWKLWCPFTYHTTTSVSVIISKFTFQREQARKYMKQ